MRQRISVEADKTRAKGPVRASVRIGVALVFGACTVVLLALLRPAPPSASAPVNAGESQSTARQESQQAGGIEARSRAETVNAAPAAAPPLTQPVVPVAFQQEPTPQSRELVSSLVGLQPENGMLTAKQAADWKETLQKLIHLGPGSVPAIREFLAKNTEFDFGVAGKEMLGYGSARAAMFDALTQIGGTQAVAALAEMLQITAEPREIAVLAQDLEKLDPGQHRVEALEAARQTLEMATGRKLETADVAPLFEVLQKYGGSGTMTELEKATAQWNYYGPIALAQIPDGAGIPSVIQMAQDPKATAATRDAALQMLAQVSDQSREARAALVEQARLNGISEFAWRIMAPVLAGDRVGFLNSAFEDPQALSQVGGMRTTSTSDNQHFFSAPAEVTPAQADQRNGLIEELLSVTSSAIGREVLEQSKALWSRRLSQVAVAAGG